MQTNKIKTYKSVVYPKSFYEKLKEEQERYIIKNRISRTSVKENNNCIIEEVDCVSSIVRLKNTDFNYIKKKKKQPQKGDKKGGTTEEKKVVTFKTSAISTAREVIVDLDETENRKCVIEELDCRLSLIQIGYNDKQEEEETDFVTSLVPILPVENASMNQEINEEVVIEEPIEITDSLTLDFTETAFEEKEPVYDINRYASSNIVDTVVWYSEDKEDVEEIPEDDISPGLNSDRFYLEGNNKEFQEEKEKVVLWSLLQMKAKLIVEGLDKNLIHSEALHTSNKVGFLSLLAFLGLLGIFTDNKACLGFWGFLYFIKYFYVKPDEVLKNHIILSAAYGYAAGMVISFLSIFLEALFDNNILLLYGMVVGMIISILVFTVVLYILQLVSIRQEQSKQAQDLPETDKTELVNSDTLVAMEQSTVNTMDIENAEYEKVENEMVEYKKIE